MAVVFGIDRIGLAAELNACDVAQQDPSAGRFHAQQDLAELLWRLQIGPGEEAKEETVRFRTVGDATCTGAVRSEATTVPQIITEIAASRVSERGATRADDRFSETSMEDRKREGYF